MTIAPRGYLFVPFALVLFSEWRLGLKLQDDPELPIVQVPPLLAEGMTGVEFRTALAEGDLPSWFLNAADGELAPVPPAWWRTEHGLTALSKGWVSDVPGAATIPGFGTGHLTVQQSAFETWGSTFPGRKAEDRVRLPSGPPMVPPRRSELPRSTPPRASPRRSTAPIRKPAVDARADRPRVYDMPPPTGYLTLPACIMQVAFHLNPSISRRAFQANFDALAATTLLSEARNLSVYKSVLLLPPSLASPQCHSPRDRAAEAATIKIPELTLEQQSRVQQAHEAETRFRPVRDQAAILLRKHFGDGTISTFLLRGDTGELEVIPPPRWRTNTALASLNGGRWPDQKGAWHGASSGVVCVVEADLHRVFPAPAEVISEPPPSPPPPEAAPRPPRGVGRPSSKKVVLEEMQARFDRGEMKSVKTHEAQELLLWLQRTHPAASRVGLPGVLGYIRELHNALLNPADPSRPEA